MNLAGIDLNLLLILDALLEERHVTRAGQRVGLSQPATSSALNRLRHVFNDPLMERIGRHMVLTERAHLLQGPLREAIARLRLVVTSAERVDPSTTEFSVRILASDQMAFIFLPALRETLRRIAPRVEVVFVWFERDRTFDLLLDGKIDFAIGVYGDAPYGCSRTPLFEDELVVMARKGHPIFTRKLTLNRFLSHPRVTVSFEGRQSSYIETALARAGAA
ncbi:MAG: LysR family transcriptional regulator, partial [Alphaproteobacteria bacterium]|nr:LysR family transcriptional regulator [Alphaproteobacteria bacterium]